MIRLELTNKYADFAYGKVVAGRYWFLDPFKPHVHPLNTPRGYTLSLRGPHDHRHHKGLMYGLRTADVNFWEEQSIADKEKLGRQRHDEFTAITSEGDEVGFEERLTWLAQDGSLETFHERRLLRCRFTTAISSSFDWEWTTELLAKRDVVLTVSPWSIANSHGRLVNYHGLGLRLRRDFGCTGGNILLLDGEPVQFSEGLGAQPKKATFIGSIDDTSPVEKAGVQFTGGLTSALFVLESPFAFISFGPTVLGGMKLGCGQSLKTTYTVSVFDDGPNEQGSWAPGAESAPRKMSSQP
jgi:methane monooxygenase PmoA-like